MSTMTDFDRRLGDWLEEGQQTIPGWLVEQALAEAHATPQLRSGPRWPWTGRLRPVPLGRLAPAAMGALAGLAVVTAFALGMLVAPRVGQDRPTPLPSLQPTLSPGPPASITSRPLGGIQVVDVLPGEAPDAVALIGLAATRDAAWTIAVTGETARLVRIDAVTGQVAPLAIPGATGLLSPPAPAGDVVWTGSAAGLHAVAASGEGPPSTLPTGFVPSEIGVSADGLWVAREGGTSLIDPATGAMLREVPAPQGAFGRIIGAPAAGSLWACLDPSTLARLDPVDGTVTGSIDLLAEADCHGRVFEVTGAKGLGDGVIPLLANVVVDPASGTVASRFDVGSWSDVVAIDGRLWFLEILRDQPGSPLALVELDPGTGGPAQVLTFEGRYHQNTAFESGYLAAAGDFLWVLADPRRGGGTATTSPQILRIPLSAIAP